MKRGESWPALPYDEWKDTYATLHMWTQVLGKIRLALAPHVNHWWQTTLYVTARGLTTSPIPHKDRLFEIQLDFIDHSLRIDDCEGSVQTIPLAGLSVASFYARTMEALSNIGVEVDIWTMPVEVPERIPFERDIQHAAYDSEYAHRFWRVLFQSARVLNQFRSGYLGKVSPVHFFWGAFDLAVTRFSGCEAPVHGKAPFMATYVAVEAYSHEVSSVGFWPGGYGVDAVYYAYAYPEPAGFAEYPVFPAEATYNTQLGEFLLPYEVVRNSDSPDETLLQFAQSTYEAAAILGKWDRQALERTRQPWEHAETTA